MSGTRATFKRLGGERGGARGPQQPHNSGNRAPIGLNVVELEVDTLGPLATTPLATAPLLN